MYEKRKRNEKAEQEGHDLLMIDDEEHDHDESLSFCLLCFET
jgi:hypothetical protein